MQLKKSKTITTEKIKTKWDKGTVVQCYLMLILPIIGFVVFTTYPILWTFRFSLYAYTGVPSQTRYIGMENFIKMFCEDFTYWKTWGNTLLYALCKIPFEIAVSMVLALILKNKSIKGSNFFRTMYYLPVVISSVIIGLIFSNLFSYFGAINTLLMRFGLIKENIDWFSTKGSAYAVLVISGIWNTFGTNVMYIFAALTNVSEDVYEAADLDGAGRFTKFFRITLPLIAPVFQTILLLSLVGTLSINEFILVLTGGGPGGKTFTVMSYLTQKFLPGFTTDAIPQLGYGCAMSVLTTIIFAVVAIVYNKFTAKMKELY